MVRKSPGRRSLEFCPPRVWGALSSLHQPRSSKPLPLECLMEASLNRYNRLNHLPLGIFSTSTPVGGWRGYEVRMAESPNPLITGWFPWQPAPIPRPSWSPQPPVHHQHTERLRPPEIPRVWGNGGRDRICISHSVTGILPLVCADCSGLQGVH